VFRESECYESSSIFDFEFAPAERAVIREECRLLCYCIAQLEVKVEVKRSENGRTNHRGGNYSNLKVRETCSWEGWIDIRIIGLEPFTFCLNASLFKDNSLNVLQFS
jgi:hypothetical protein